MQDSTRIIVVSLAMAVGIVLASSALVSGISRAGGAESFQQHPWLRLTLVQILLAGFSMILMAAIKARSWRQFGFALPGRCPWHWLIILSLTSGMLATTATLLVGAGPHSIMAKLSFPQIVLLIWGLASICEEIFTRGLIQGFLTPLANRTVSVGFLSLPVPVLLSAVVFSLMHLGLLFAGTSSATVCIILIFTFFLGLIAGHFRQRSGSLIPAIVAHSLGNIGGLLGGILYFLTRVLLTGQTPGM
ncbi:CPBP family intramembrane metalloprotease [bacterium]|nr:CPBP family intramembrane metalloprotease [candidate division CSSED10-310 bacterium]